MFTGLSTVIDSVTYACAPHHFHTQSYVASSRKTENSQQEPRTKHRIGAIPVGGCADRGNRNPACSMARSHSTTKLYPHGGEYTTLLTQLQSSRPDVFAGRSSNRIHAPH